MDVAFNRGQPVKFIAIKIYFPRRGGSGGKSCQVGQLDKAGGFILRVLKEGLFSYRF